MYTLQARTVVLAPPTLKEGAWKLRLRLACCARCHAWRHRAPQRRSTCARRAPAAGHTRGRHRSARALGRPGRTTRALRARRCRRTAAAAAAITHPLPG